MSSDYENIPINMDRFEVRNYTAYIPDEYGVDTRFGGWNIWFGFPGPISSGDQYHVDTIRLENIKAYPVYHKDLPEATLIHLPRVRKLIIRDVEAENVKDSIDNRWITIQV